MELPQAAVARDVGTAVAKALPPLTIWALTLNEWLALASIAYLILQAAYLLWKWRAEAALARRAGSAEVDRLMAGRVAQPGEKAPK